VATHDETIDDGEPDMSTDLEHALRRALDATNGIVRAPERDMAARAKRDHRRRRTVRWAAAGAALVAVAGIPAAIGIARPDATGRPAATPTPVYLMLDPSTARPIADIWPRALRTLPGRLPNGSDYIVIDEVAAGSFVVQARTGRGRYGSVYRFEPGSGAFGALIDASRLNPSTTRAAPLGLAAVVDGRYVAAQALEDAGESSIVEVVSVSDGSRVARIELPAGTEVGVMDWADGHLLWTPVRDLAVHSAADPPAPVPGSNGFYLIGRGAWAVAERSGQEVEWWNLATGERHTVPAPGSLVSPCGTACVISNAASGRLQIIGIDGPGGLAQTMAGESYLTPSGDHFAVVESNHGGSAATQLLWNLHTNTYALLPATADPADIIGSDMDILVLTSTADQKVIVNLTAID
jgi:hypothetical protein